MRDLEKTVGVGWMMEKKNKATRKRYYISDVGVCVEQGLGRRQGMLGSMVRRGQGNEMASIC